MGKGSRALPRNSPQILRVLLRREVVNRAFVDEVNRLRHLRNQVAHGQHDPSVGEAVA